MKIKRAIKGGLLLFTGFYLVFAFWYLSSIKNSASEQHQTHAAIIADDLWNLNEAGMTAYLSIAAKTGHYTSIDVLSESNELFLHIDNSVPVALDRLFVHLHLIPVKVLSTPVLHRNETIGVLRGQRLVRTIYPLTAIFFGELVIGLLIIFVLNLIFHRRSLEQIIVERTKRYHDMINLLPEMVVETERDGTVTFANEIAMKRLGIVAEEAIALNCNDLIIDERSGEKSENIINQLLDEPLAQNEYNVRDVAGNISPVLLRSAPIMSGKQLVGSRIVIVDITEQKKLREQLNRDQKMKSIGVMAGGVAHDLNNILSGIINYPELILPQLPEESTVRRQVEAIKLAGQRAAAVVADLLTVARGVAATRTVANLNSLVQEYLESPEFAEILTLYKEARYDVSLTDDACNICCSPIHVRKCLMNLVINGFESLSSGGTVTIRTYRVMLESPVQTIHSKIDSGKYMTLSVQDTGCGISPEDMEHIFEPFYSSKELAKSGTGLGLAVVWNTIQDHQGGIVVNSGREGTEFQLYIPCSDLPLEESSKEENLAELRGNGETVLIVDDEPHQRDIAINLLNSLEYKATAVRSGEEAVVYLQQQRVDLLLLDMVMGAGLSGRQTYEKIIQYHPGQKAIIISGFSESEDVKQTLNLGAGRLINKPYSQYELAKAVYLELATELPPGIAD